MGASYGDLYLGILWRLGFDPQNTGYRLGVRREFNDQLTEFCRMHPWTFLMRNAVLPFYGDYVTGTAELTNGSNLVDGTLTAWTTTMEEAWIAPGSDPNPGEFVRIGRVSSGTRLYLVEPYTGTSTGGPVAYTIRFRYKRLPRDCMTLKGLGPGTDFNLDLGMISAEEAIDRGYSEWINTTGTVRYLIPATPPDWDEGSGIPRTPDLAPTLALGAAAGSLITNHIYEYRYTWYTNGTETGSSPTASITAVAPNLTVTVSNLTENTVGSGRYVKVYRRDKTADTPWYLISTQNGASSISDDGTVTDRTKVYYDSDMAWYVRPWPRPSNGDTYNIQIRYHSRPREVQKDSDYPEMFPDAVTAVKTMTIMALAMKHNSPGLVAQLRPELERQMKGLRSLYLSQSVEPLVRRGTSFPGDRRIPAWLNRNITQS